MPLSQSWWRWTYQKTLVVHCEGSVVGKWMRYSHTVIHSDVDLSAWLAHLLRINCYISYTKMIQLLKFVSSKKDSIVPYVLRKCNEFIALGMSCIDVWVGTSKPYHEFGCQNNSRQWIWERYPPGDTMSTGGRRNTISCYTKPFLII